MRQRGDNEAQLHALFTHSLHTQTHTCGNCGNLGTKGYFPSRYKATVGDKIFEELRRLYVQYCSEALKSTQNKGRYGLMKVDVL